MGAFMGYFANLYIVEVDVADGVIKARTTIYGNWVNKDSYVCWGPGERPSGLHSYANGTVCSDVELKLLPGYPMIETVGTSPDEALIQANFRPKGEKDAVLFHFVLPERFIPRGDLQPLDQPTEPFVYPAGERIVVTYPVEGRATVRFRISRIENHESLADFQYEKLLHSEAGRSLKVGVELNLGLFKLKFG